MEQCGNNRDGCEITEHNGWGSQYPYECNAKDNYPTHTVFKCATHGTWWHKLTRNSLMYQSVKLYFPELVK